MLTEVVLKTDAQTHLGDFPPMLEVDYTPQPLVAAMPMRPQEEAAPVVLFDYGRLESRISSLEARVEQLARAFAVTEERLGVTFWMRSVRQAKRLWQRFVVWFNRTCRGNR